MKVQLALVLLLVPCVLALQFTSPQNGSAYNAPANVTFTWDTQPVDFSIDGGQSQTINDTTTTVTLAAGNHTATINDGNTTASVSVQVTAVQPANLSINTDHQTYEVGSPARITMVVSKPTQLLLTISRNGQTTDSYTVTVQQQTDFLYTIGAVGNYVATISASGVQASANFVSQNTSVGASINGPSSPTAGRIAAYTAVVSGGTGPYTYFWQFSDNTTSTSQEADHVFSDNGTYTISLLVTDSLGKQASASMNVTATIQTYRVSVTVLGKDNTLLANAIVTLTDSRGGGRSLTTSLFGETHFTAAPEDNYTLNVTYNDTNQNPVVTYTDSQQVLVNQDTTTQFNLPVPDPAAPATANTTAATDNTSTNDTTDSAPLLTQQTAQLQAQAAADAAAQAAAQAAADAAAQFQKTKTDALADLRAKQQLMQSSDDKQAVLDAVGLSGSYDTVAAAIAAAATDAAVSEAQQQLPQDVVIVAKDTSVHELSDTELAQGIAAVATARGADAKQTKQLDYNIRLAAKNTTITEKRILARVSFGDGTRTSYTIYSRVIAAPDGTSFVEIIPKSLAADASQLHIQGASEVMQADPVIRFLSNTYSYYVTSESSDEPLTVPVPLQLAEQPSLIGYVAVKLQLSSFAHGSLYAVILGLVLAVLIGANVYMRKQEQSSSKQAFQELTDLTITTVEQGNYGLVAKYATELRSVHATLGVKEQKETRDIIVFIDSAAAVHEFRTAADHLQTLISLNDTNALASAYERVMERYAQLSEDFQAHEKQTLERVHTALETHLTHA